jgi:hypothetical protein
MRFCGKCNMKTELGEWSYYGCCNVSTELGNGVNVGVVM